MSSHSEPKLVHKIIDILGLMGGFAISVMIRFIKTAFKEIVTSKNKLNNEAPMKSKIDPLQADLSLPVQAYSKVSSTVELEVAVSHLQMHSGVIRDANTKVIHLSLYTGPQPRIERMLRVPCEKLYFQRINWRFDRIPLPQFTPEIAEKTGLPFNFDGAKKYSHADFNTESLFANRAATAQSEIPFKPKNVCLAKVSSHEEQTENTVAAPLGNVSEAEGTVLSASSVVVAPEGKPQYKSFAVVLATTSGEVTFQGVDLEEKFKTYHFSIGDLVSIKKSLSKFEFTKPNKKTEMRSKNVFAITVLKNASL